MNCPARDAHEQLAGEFLAFDSALLVKTPAALPRAVEELPDGVAEAFGIDDDAGLWLVILQLAQVGSDGLDRQPEALGLR